MINKNKITLFSTSLIIMLILAAGCKKEAVQNEIPVIAVNIAINPNSTEYYQLNTVGGWVYLTGGYRGIIVYRSNVNEFTAYERACPYDWDQGTTSRLVVDASGITASCPVCKSKFILLDGSVYGGPSHYPMKSYQTYYDGSILYISN